MRISERPVVLAMRGAHTVQKHCKLCGKDMGFLYSEKGPIIQLLGLRKIRDQLTKSRIVRR